MRAPGTPRKGKGTHTPLPRGGHQSPGEGSADLSPPAGRRMLCGRRQRALTARCPARCPATQGCVPAATRISASCPGGTAAGGLGGEWGLALARCGEGSALTSCSLSRLCQGKVCHTCSVDMGKHGRCCLICYQQRHPQAT